MWGQKLGRFIDQLLYRSYHRGNAVGDFIRQRVNPGAWLLLLGGGTSVFLGANLDESLTAILTLFILSLLFSSFVWAFLRRAKLSVVRALPFSGAVGEILRYRVSVRNNGRRAVRGFYLSEAGGDARPNQWEFFHLKEPGEVDRNFFDRFFKFYRWKWLVGRGGAWVRLGRSKPLDLEPGEERQIHLAVKPFRRGGIRFSDMRAELPDPFGFFQRCCPILNEEAEVLITPRRYRLPNLDLGGTSELKAGLDTSSTVRGEGGHFMGLREYREGDSLRCIHWKAWARTGQPIVKEFEELRFPRYGVVLDTNLKETGPQMFEEAISVAASFVWAIEKNGSLMDLIFMREDPKVHTAGRGVARTNDLFEALARIEGVDEGDYECLGRLITQNANDLTACVVVLAGWCSKRRAFLERLRGSGLVLIVYAIGIGDAPEDALLYNVKWLRWDFIEEDLMTR
jgi:uncharacterized protein (DUF58 family)